MRPAVCEFCGGPFEARGEYNSSLGDCRRRFCSRRCAQSGRQAKIRATYPPEDAVRQAFYEEGISDRDFGRRHGRSYQWSLSVRNHYGIRALPTAKKYAIKRKKRQIRTFGQIRQVFNIKEKGETSCRNCGAEEWLHLHHAVPRSMSLKGRTDLLNGVPLCVRCHLGWHNGQVVVHRDVFTPEEWDRVCGLVLAVNGGLGWLDDRYPPRVASLAA